MASRFCLEAVVCNCRVRRNNRARVCLEHAIMLERRAHRLPAVATCSGSHISTSGTNNGNGVEWRVNSRCLRQIDHEIDVCEISDIRQAFTRSSCQAPERNELGQAGPLLGSSLTRRSPKPKLRSIVASGPDNRMEARSCQSECGHTSTVGMVSGVAQHYPLQESLLDR